MLINTLSSNSIGWGHPHDFLTHLFYKQKNYYEAQKHLKSALKRLSCYYWICNNKDFIQKYIDDVIIGFTQTGSYFFIFMFPIMQFVFPTTFFVSFVLSYSRDDFLSQGKQKTRLIHNLYFCGETNCIMRNLRVSNRPYSRYPLSLHAF